MTTEKKLGLFSIENDAELQRVVRTVENEKNKVRLRTWEINAIVSTLEESLEQIVTRIRRTSLKKKRDVMHLSFVPTDVRYLDLIKSRLLYTSEERALKDMETEAVLKKLESDGTYAVNILEETVEELKSNGSFCILNNIEKKLTDESDKNSSVINRAKKNVEAFKNLREIVAQEKHANEFEKYIIIKKLATALREMEIQCTKGKTSIAYVAAWEKARCEQNIARCNIAEENLGKTLARLEIDEKNEKRITKEIESFLCYDIQKNQEQIIYWENRYDREWAEYKNEIDKLEKHINLEKSALKRLKEEQRVKQEFIDAYLAEKEADRKKKEHEEHVRKSTIKIQAWWRGVMVRRKLGPYRPEEKKKKRSNKSKK